MVAVMWVLATTQTILLVIGQYNIFVKGFGDLLVLIRVPLITVLAILPAALVVIMADSVLTHQLWRLSQKNIIFPLILVIPHFYNID